MWLACRAGPAWLLSNLGLLSPTLGLLSPTSSRMPLAFGLVRQRRVRLKAEEDAGP